MTKRKRKSKPKPRRNTYERSLDAARERLDKATAERLTCMVTLQALNQEIPYLEGIIKALAAPTVDGASLPIPASMSSAPASFSQDDFPNVPAHLKAFLPPVVGRTMRRGQPVTVETPGPPVSTGEGSDEEFLPEPDGKEVIE